MLGRLFCASALAARLSAATDTSRLSPCLSCIWKLYTPSPVPASAIYLPLSSLHTSVPFSARGPSARSVIPPQTDAVRETAETESTEGEEDDKLYRMIELEIKGHENAVLSSYQWFLCRAAKELGVRVSRVFTPLRHYERMSLLKSRFIYKKHFVQYEIRTYSRVIQVKHLTGSTADTYLEYVQRNLPEGVAMKVLKCQIEQFPGHLLPPQDQESHKEAAVT